MVPTTGYWSPALTARWAPIVMLQYTDLLQAPEMDWDPLGISQGQDKQTEQPPARISITSEDLASHLRISQISCS